jgi:hypothetical protein
MISSRKREKEKSKRKFHIRRTHAQLKIVSSLEAPPIEDVRIVLNDISPKSMNLFCSHPVALGQVAAITIEEPTRIYVRGRIVGCQELDYDTHVITDQPYTYRVCVLFLFDSEEEQKAFKIYCDQLATEVLGTAALKAG